MATLSRGECLDPCPDRLLLLFWAHYIEDDPHLLCTGFGWLQKTKGRMLLITSKKKAICKLKEKVVELVTLVLGRFGIDFRKLL